MEKALQWMILEINKKQHALEEECHMLNELLKPWPLPKNEASKIQSEIHPSHKKVSTDEHLSKEEQEALLTVEKLLKKAQITRQVKTKSKVQEENNFSSTKESSFDDSTRTAPQQSKNTHDHHCKTQTFSVDTQPHSGRLLYKDHVTSNHSHADAHKYSSSGSNASSPAQSSQTLNKNISSKNKPQSHQPVSHTNRPSRPASGKNRYVPVHMSAPFKTENLKMPMRRKNHTLSQSRHTTSSKPRPDSGLSCASYKTLPAIKHAGGGKTNCNHSKLEEISVQSDDGASIITQDNHRRTETSNLGDSSEESNFVTAGETEIDGQPDIQKPQQSTETGIENELERFALKRDGSSLKIPGKLAKLVNLNNSLCQQCSAARLIKKVSQSTSGQQFVDRLQGEWTISEELWTRVRAFTCLRAHRNLLEMFQGLELEKLTAQSSYQALYKAKRTLEFILSMFASLQEESDYLSRVQFREVDPLPQNNQGSRESDLSNISFSDCHQGYQNEDLEQYLKQYLNGCEEWTHLKFTEKYLSIQMWLLELVRSEWWQALSADTRDASVLQGLYSLVSSGGQFPPAFVSNK
ncbi:hypothetical protein ElyMa_004539600 [Elysia marginata]|uniref:Uncharacterized protein n=1 Tax=Elysia marginata TaxID=1093978 RepID=A0AAV4HTP1_9GAST|nr:hypothetical protein ElyMa_004539600 [Elysia marginata]